MSGNYLLIITHIDQWLGGRERHFGQTASRPFAQSCSSFSHCKTFLEETHFAFFQKTKLVGGISNRFHFHDNDDDDADDADDVDNDNDDVLRIKMSHFL